MNLPKAYTLQPVDSTNKRIYIEDTVTRDEKTGTVITLLNQEEVLVEWGTGIPAIEPAKTLLRTKSMIESLLSLKTNEELQKILAAAESRLAAEAKEKKAASGKVSLKSNIVETEV